MNSTNLCFFIVLAIIVIFIMTIALLEESKRLNEEINRIDIQYGTEIEILSRRVAELEMKQERKIFKRRKKKIEEETEK